MAATFTATDQERIVRGYQAQLRRLRSQAANAVGLTWDLLGRWTGPDVEDVWLTQVLPIVAAGQMQAAGLAAAYVGQLGLAATGVPADVPIDTGVYVGGAVRKGVGPENVYRRPLVQLWGDLADGTDFLKARQDGRGRAVGLADMDVRLAARQAANDAMATDERIVGYRRVPSGVFTCRFCAVASTQRYHKRDLLALHAHCDCSEVPIWGTEDPGQIINDKLLDELKATKTRPDYWNQNEKLDTEALTRGEVDPVKYRRPRPVESLDELARQNPDVTVREHGELGPVLVSDKHHFTGPRDIGRGRRGRTPRVF